MYLLLQPLFVCRNTHTHLCIYLVHNLIFSLSYTHTNFLLCVGGGGRHVCAMDTLCGNGFTLSPHGSRLGASALPTELPQWSMNKNISKQLWKFIFWSFYIYLYQYIKSHQPPLDHLLLSPTVLKVWFLVQQCYCYLETYYKCNLGLVSCL